MAGAAGRYAQALWEAAAQSGDTAAVGQALAEVAVAARGAWGEVWRSKAMTRAAKHQLVMAAWADRVPALVTNLLRLLVDHGREGELDAIAGHWQALADRQAGVVAVQVVTAVPLAEGVATGLAATLRQKTGREVRLSVTVDRSLLGGLTVQVNDTVFDGSVRGSLGRLHRRLLGTNGGGVWA